MSKIRYIIRCENNLPEHAIRATIRSLNRAIDSYRQELRDMGVNPYTDTD